MNAGQENDGRDERNQAGFGLVFHAEIREIPDLDGQENEAGNDETRD